MLRFVCIFLFLIGISPTLFSQYSKNWDYEMVEVLHPSMQGVLMSSVPIYSDEWDVLPQPNFWKQIMKLSPDSCLVNVASNRIIVAKMSNKDWARQTEEQKTLFKDSIKRTYQLDSSERIYITTGKNDFYRFNDVYPSLTRGILAFESQNVDPWYAQAILLIESPGQLKKSSAGAYGAFQLMPAVARANGLIVNKYIDERKDFEKSAMGAASLIQKICIPEAKRILNDFNISYSESDLWFRLFVLHVYHAGALNVRAVVTKINPEQGGQELIKTMWQTSAASFGNNSQNYTQLALASQLIIAEMTKKDCVKLFHCEETETAN